MTLASCEQRFRHATGEVWATTYNISYCDAPRPLDDSIRAVMADVDSALSLFNGASDLAAVNAGSPVPGAHFRAVYPVAHAVWRASGGAYDPTIAPVAALWGFGRGDVAAAPSDSAVAAALACVGMDKCALDGDTLRRSVAGLRFDFSSVAKGYGVDRVADMLVRNGARDYMVEIGGEVSVGGHNPRGEQWHIQIDSPLGGMGHSRLAVLVLGPERVAVATSGNYRNIRTDSTGRSWAHTLSPLTGRPVRSDILSATVVASDCALADALATACMAVGRPDSALAMTQRMGAEALLVCAPADSIAIVTTPGMSRYGIKP
ncbi:MAG: FAD:protein FMN transferase [Muribaculaceae bacterium]|nr:FAD:protein FMN transferase [Muribaculaceae bacterium]